MIEVQPGYAFMLDLDTWEMTSQKWAREEKIVPRTASRADLAAELEDILDRSVKRHLVSDVPVGALLSGGIDSSLVTALAARHAPHIAAFTMGFRDKTYDESDYAAALARRYGLKHHIVYCEDDDFLALLDDWPLVMDDAVANPSTVLLYAISKFAREAGHKVLLAGEGADEFFGGYNQQWRFQLARKLHPVGRFMPCLPGWIEKAAPHKTRLINAARMATTRCAYHGTSTIFEPYLVGQGFLCRRRTGAARKDPAGGASPRPELSPARRHADGRRPRHHARLRSKRACPFITREVARFAAPACRKNC